jgi:hypothetical protein
MPTFREKLIALLSLTAVSTAIGYSMKASQVKGKYDYSPMSATAMVELFKMTVSSAFVAKIIAQGAAEKGCSCEQEAQSYARENYSPASLMHCAGLSVAYSIVNLVTFGAMVHVGASTFFLLKAASPVVTALLLAGLIGRPIAAAQWAAILMQCVGIVATQYDPCSSQKSSSTSALGYVFVLINVTVGCVAGVWNEWVIKTYGSSLNAHGVAMYAYGIVFAVVLFMTVPSESLGSSSALGFFENYNLPVLAVICANGSIGLVISAVYKYADVVVKTFGAAGSTVLLFLLERMGILPMPPGTQDAGFPRLSAVLAAAAVFYASYVYIAPPITEPLPPSSPTSPVAATEMDAAEANRGGNRDVSGRATPEAQQQAGCRPVPLHRNHRVVALGVLALSIGLASSLDGRHC